MCEGLSLMVLLAASWSLITGVPLPVEMAMVVVNGSSFESLLRTVVPLALVVGCR